MEPAFQLHVLVEAKSGTICRYGCGYSQSCTTGCIRVGNTVSPHTHKAVFFFLFCVCVSTAVTVNDRDARVVLGRRSNTARELPLPFSPPLLYTFTGGQTYNTESACVCHARSYIRTTFLPVRDGVAPAARATVGDLAVSLLSRSFFLPLVLFWSPLCFS